MDEFKGTKNDNQDCTGFKLEFNKIITMLIEKVDRSTATSAKEQLMHKASARVSEAWTRHLSH